jgi:flavodoxin I
VVGSSTWHAGDLQDDWEAVLEDVAGASWRGTRVAPFGTGDPHGYPETFADALDTLASTFVAAGAELIGTWPAPADAPSGSRARRGASFVGLALDADLPVDAQDAAARAWCRSLLATAL